MVHKVDDLNTRFVELGKKANELGIQSRLGAISVADATLRPANRTAIAPLSSSRTSRETVSIVGQKVMGRKNDEKVLVHKLLRKSDELLTSVPIIGMGGLGKTTLAQSIYNNKQVLDHFGKRIWISVPQGIEPMSIFRLILESLDESSNRDNITLDVVVQKIKEKLQDKRYLLVLDDVWSGHSQLSWGNFLESLQGISTTAGNCIVITTREVPVALIFCARREDHIFVEKLSDEDCLEIVKEKAVIYEESVQYFEAMRRNIGKVCQGVPLVARVIGGLLSTTPANDWDSILQEGISNMVENEYKSINQILQLSYDHLHSPSLKKCFTYCSLFGKNSAMDKKELILLWMAQGFIQPKPGHDDLKIGSEYINSLIGSSLLEEVIDEEGECDCVRMHDLVHDLAESISKPVRDLKDLKEQDRHIAIDLYEEGTEAFPKMKMVRTLFMENGALNSMLLTSFKYLHVLKLSHLRNDEFPSSIGKLIHLRYLGVLNCDFKTFPESTSELYNLQTLRIKGCWSLKALPEGITKLINLRHLHCDCNFNYVSVPPKIGRLTNLQTVTGRFVISEYSQFKEFGFLKNFMAILRLENLEYLSNKEEAQQASLNRKPITSLSYSWGLKRFREDVNYEAVLEGLEPHPNLQDLRIDNYEGTQFPSWFMNMVVCLDQNPISSHRLDKLVCLEIYYCKRCKQLPSLGQLPSLEYLYLVGLDSISCIEPSFYGTFTHHVPIFPALRTFSLEGMPNLTEWMGYQTTESTTEAVEIFPNLEQLRIYNCEKLRYAPIHYSHRLKDLSVRRTNLDLIIPVMEKDQNCQRFPNSESELSEHIHGFGSLRDLEIRDCSNLKSLSIPTDFHGKAQPLTSLESLLIVGCHGLNSFPHELINSYASLSYLAIGGFCDSVKVDWSALSSISSISMLELNKWPNWVSLPDQLQHLTRLWRLRLCQLGNIETLPDWFANLGSLEFLQLENLEKLCQLPSMAAMRNLKHLEIINCPLLQERCTPRSSPDSEWTKISHISRILIDGTFIRIDGKIWDADADVDEDEDEDEDEDAAADVDEDEDEEGRMSKCCGLRMRCF